MIVILKATSMWEHKSQNCKKHLSLKKEITAL